jgi:hypothetical protein
MDCTHRVPSVWGDLTVMKLTRVEQERISDSRLKIQAVAESLKHLDPAKVEDFEGIRNCLDDANRNLGAALRSSRSEEPN